jgi:hypothetical protein
MTKFVLLASTTALCMVARAGDGGNDAIVNALGQLDPNNNDHWTADGLARIDTVKALSGDSSLTREALEKARPGFNREIAGGENRVGNGMPTDTSSAQSSDTAPPPPATGQGSTDPMTAATADGWVAHPTAEGFLYKGQDVKSVADVTAMYDGSTPGVPSAPDGAQLKADGTNGPDTNAETISGQTGMGGAMTARSPEPVEGELRKTHVSELSQGQPGEAPIGVVQGVTEQGVNTLGTPEGTVENAGRSIELSGEVAARNAGSVLAPAQAVADSTSPASRSGVSLGGAADPAVEAAAPGGAVIAEGADPATFFEGQTVGGPFGTSGITASDGSNQTKLTTVGDVDFDGDPDAVEALETQLAEQAEKSAELRSQVDDLSNQLNTSLRTEAQLRRQIEANRPRSANMTTIQTFLRTAHERRAAANEEERRLREALGKKA